METKAIASELEVSSIEEAGDYPHVYVRAKVTLVRNGVIVKSVNTEGIRRSLEDAVAEGVKLEVVR